MSVRRRCLQDRVSHPKLRRGRPHLAPGRCLHDIRSTHAVDGSTRCVSRGSFAPCSHGGQETEGEGGRLALGRKLASRRHSPVLRAVAAPVVGGRFPMVIARPKRCDEKGHFELTATPSDGLRRSAIVRISAVSTENVSAGPPGAAASIELRVPSLTA